MNIKGFFVDALTSALDLGIGTPDDVIRHVTPDVLATHLPRPLWARLFTACLGAPRVDAQLIVETIGVPNICEHIPAPTIWACIAEIGARSLGKMPDIAVAPAPLPPRTTTNSTRSVLAPPPDEKPTPVPTATVSAPVAIGPSIPAPAPTAAVNQPLADLITELEQTDGAGEPKLAQLRPRSPTAQRFRQSNTGIQRLGGARRPQASAPISTLSARSRREPTEAEPDIDTGTQTADKDRGDIAVDDSQLVDWQATDGSGSPAMPDNDDFSDLGRKR